MAPKNYGRQAEGKTIKSLSLEKSVVDWVEAEAKKQGVSFSRYMNDFLKEQIPQNVTDFPKKRAHIAAAAGPGIMAEVTEWDGKDDLVCVKICGDSMSPLFQDGEVIDMTHKRASRSLYMKKGLIYLVQLNGEWMVKRYGTRPARPDEKDADYLTARGTVGVLKSENPTYDDIDITGECEWSAWFHEA